MQQELIEMLEEIIPYVEVWNAHDQSVLDKAEALIEKAKNSAKEPAVQQGEQINKALGKLRAAQWCHPNEVERLIDEAIDALVAATPAPAQEEGLTARQFDLICQAIDKADTITMEGDYMLDSDDCISVVRVMQVLFDIKSFAQRKISCEQA